MPKNSSAARREQARSLAAAGGISYTAALRRLDTASVGDPPIALEALAAASIDPAAGPGEDDWSLEARRARVDAAQLEYWEQRRAGRPVRLWTAEIEVRCAAVDEMEAWWRVAVGYMRCPRYRAPGLQTDTVSLPEHDFDPAARDVARVPDDQVDQAERRRLEADYPRRPMPWPQEWTPRGPEKEHDIAAYVMALRLGAARASGDDFDPDEPEAVPAGTHLSIWRAVHSAQFLAGLEVASARRRAQELAATVVDWAGRPLGRVIDVEPDDGFRSATDGRWVHPACWGGTSDAEALWDDYDLEGLHAGSLPRVLSAAAADLEKQWKKENAEMAAYDARLHTHPDGTRTLSTPTELAQLADAVRSRHSDKTPDELRAEAEQRDYMARRVYGKVVENDEDEKRIERATHEAKVLRALADDIEARAAQSR